MVFLREGFMLNSSFQLNRYEPARGGSGASLSLHRDREPADWETDCKSRTVLPKPSLQRHRDHVSADNHSVVLAIGSCSAVLNASRATTMGLFQSFVLFGQKTPLVM